MKSVDELAEAIEALVKGYIGAELLGLVEKVRREELACDGDYNELVDIAIDAYHAIPEKPQCARAVKLDVYHRLDALGIDVDAGIWND